MQPDHYDDILTACDLIIELTESCVQFLRAVHTLLPPIASKQQQLVFSLSNVLHLIDEPGMSRDSSCRASQPGKRARRLLLKNLKVRMSLHDLKALSDFQCHASSAHSALISLL